MNLIEQFESVRDIPYRIPSETAEEDHCCNGKARLLKAALEKQGLEVRFRVVSFLWSKLGLPEDVEVLIKDNEATHVYLEVKIGEKWVDVDPTWDVGLKDVFPVATWDGKSNTTIAVPIKEKLCLKESQKIMTACENLPDQPIQSSNQKFEEAFNTWLQKVRTK